MKTTNKLLLALSISLAVAACSKPAEAPADAAAPATTEAPAAAPAEPAVEAIKGQSGTYTLDPTHTDVLVEWTHFGFSKPSAHFGITEGKLVYDADDASKSSVEVTIPVTAIDTFVPKLDEHLKGADFFDAGKFPTATFKSTSVAAAGTNKLTVTGDLTVKGTTKPVTLDVTINGAGEHPMMKLPSVGFDATTTLKRSDFGVGAYAPAVSDEVKVRITTEASIPKAE